MTTPEKIDDGGSVTADLISERFVAGHGTLEEKVKSVGGLSIRDYFAAAALTGFYANSETAASDLELAIWSYSIADAMIEARKEGA
jgi:hypothetical protein